jgi:hypothetical protein
MCCHLLYWRKLFLQQGLAGAEASHASPGGGAASRAVAFPSRRAARVPRIQFHPVPRQCPRPRGIGPCLDSKFFQLLILQRFHLYLTNFI